MNFFKNIKIRKHVTTVDKHFTVLNNRYLNVYGDVIEASRTKDPGEMLAYLANGAGIKNGMKLLDAGCGVCGPARYFASHFDVTIEAVTATKLQAEIAEQRNKEANLDKRIKVKHGDFHFLSDYYPANSFDIVYFFESFCHSYDIQRVMDEVHKVLKPGGAIYMKDWFLAERLKNKNTELYAHTKRRINEFYSFNFKDGINELKSVEDYLTSHGFKVEFGRTPGYEKGDYELTALFHGNNDIYGPNNEYQENNLVGQINDVFDVIEIFELKAVKK
ncbi:MAG: Methyltransferase type 11 [Bacteroidota bacterium]|nr:Methyltransferase type 11 [Bacteroidota bacterium]